MYSSLLQSCSQQNLSVLRLSLSIMSAVWLCARIAIGCVRITNEFSKLVSVDKVDAYGIKIPR